MYLCCFTIIPAMWSSKVHSSSTSTTQPTLDPNWTEWTQVTASTISHPIPVLNDGTLELDLARHTQLERVASAPLHYNALPHSKEFFQSDNAKKEAVRVYVNQQGHTVKLAQLAAPPSLYAVTSRGKFLWEKVFTSLGLCILTYFNFLL